MMTERQSEILSGIIKEYVKLAQPVSSQLLERRRNLTVSSATIRNEMQELTDKGYLCQPHTSAGRVPTDKGYRFFVDRLMNEFPKSIEVLMDFGDRSSDDSLVFIKGVTKFLSEESSNLALGYLTANRILWKEGWQDIFQEPEFVQPGLAAAFAKMIDDFEDNIDDIYLPDDYLPAGVIKIYIGRENPVSKIKDFSIITFGFDGGLFAILGPKRMSYDKNIGLFQRIWQKI